MYPGLDAFAGVRSPRRVLLNRRPEVARGLPSAGCRLCACLVSHAWHRRSAYKQKQTRDTEFFFTPYAGRVGWFLVDLKPNMANFFPTAGHFFGRKRFPNSQKEISVVNSISFFCQTKNVIRWEKSSPCWVSGPPKIIQIGPHRELKKNAEVGHSH